MHDMAEDDLDPFPFHIANVALHAGVTCLLYLLALRLCMLRDARDTLALSTAEHVPCADPDEGLGAPEDTRRQRAAAAEAGLRQRRGSLADLGRLPQRQTTGCMQDLHRGMPRGSLGLAASPLLGSHSGRACTA